MKKLSVLLILAFAGFVLIEKNPTAADPDFSQQQLSASDQYIASAFQDKKSDIQVKGSGEVIRILPDDIEGSRHQKFILKLASGQTLLISHNIDLAPRIKSLSEGDEIEFYGEYEWNSQGGVVHWTHRDPQGRHEHGWLRHGGITYQ